MNNPLHDRIPGRNIEYHDIIDSTNIRAKQLGAAGAPHMTLVLANEQTAGRGRMTRSWVSPPGTSALMSLLVRPRLPAWRAPELVFISAVAACDAVNALTHGEHARIKWPNDLVIGRKKISGTLLEMALDGADIDYAVVGIGINVLGVEFPAELPYAGSIESAAGQQVQRMALVAEYLDRFDALSYLYLTRVMDYFDPFADPEAAARVAAGGTRVLVVSFDTDWRFSTAHSRRIVRHLEGAGVPTSFREISSQWGHDSFLLQIPDYHATVSAFMGRAADELGLGGRR